MKKSADVEQDPSIEAAVERLVSQFDHLDPHLSKDVLDEAYHRLPEQGRMPFTEAHGGMHLAIRSQDIIAIERETTTFCSAGGITHPVRPGEQIRAIPMEFDPPEHALYRKFFTDVISLARVKKAEPVLREIVDELLAEFVRGTDQDFITNVALKLPVCAIGVLMGWDKAVTDSILEYAMKVLGNFGSEEAVRAYYQDLGALVYGQIQDRREHPRDDYTTTMVNSSIDGRPLTDPELQNMMQVFVLAGFETTAHAIGHLVLRLAERPDLQDRLRSDPSARDAAIEEGLRVFPPVHTMFRTVTEPAHVADVEFAVGDKVALLYAAANRDAEVFEDPMTFDIDRPNLRQHIAFGFGIHHCAGAPLAHGEMRVLLEALADHPNFELAGSAEYSPNLMFGQIMGVEHLPIRFLAAD